MGLAVLITTASIDILELMVIYPGSAGAGHDEPCLIYD